MLSSKFFSWEYPFFITFLLSSYNESFAKHDYCFYSWSKKEMVQIERIWVQLNDFQHNIVFLMDERHAKYRSWGSLQIGHELLSYE